MVRLESRCEPSTPPQTPTPGASDPRQRRAAACSSIWARIWWTRRCCSSVRRSLSTLRWIRAAPAPPSNDTFVALRFAGGQMAHLWMSVVPRLPAPRYRAVGLRGVYEKHGVDPQEDALRLGGHPGDEGRDRSRQRRGTAGIEIAGMQVDGRGETAPGNYESYYAVVRDAIRWWTPTSHASRGGGGAAGDRGGEKVRKREPSSNYRRW